MKLDHPFISLRAAQPALKRRVPSNVLNVKWVEAKTFARAWHGDDRLQVADDR